jgi:hypothetical protein
MKAPWLIASAFAVTCATLAAEPGAPPEGSTPEFELATYCSASLSHLSAMFSRSPNPDFARKLGSGAQRWYLHAYQLGKADADMVLDRIEAHSQAMAQARFKAGLDQAQVSALWREDIAKCEAAEKATFGTTFRQL